MSRWSIKLLNFRHSNRFSEWDTKPKHKRQTQNTCSRFLRFQRTSFLNLIIGELFNPVRLQRKITRVAELSAANFKMEGSGGVCTFFVVVFVVGLRWFTQALRDVNHQYTCNNTVGLP